MNHHRGAVHLGIAGAVGLLLLSGIGPIGASPPPSQVRADAQEEAVEQRIEQADHDRLVHEALAAEADHGKRKGFLARLFRRRSR